ncbi:MAG: hypothetical protein WCV91_03315 [Candidatus Margulisiibacteriota bacterium]
MALNVCGVTNLNVKGIELIRPDQVSCNGLEEILKSNITVSVPQNAPNEISITNSFGREVAHGNKPQGEDYYILIASGKFIGTTKLIENKWHYYDVKGEERKTKPRTEITLESETIEGSQPFDFEEVDGLDLKWIREWRKKNPLLTQDKINDALLKINEAEMLKAAEGL